MTDVVAPAPATSRPSRRVLAASFPFVAAVAVSVVVLLAVGSSPIEFYRLLGREAFGGRQRIAATLASTTPLLFSGAATAIAFRAGVFNIGVEGSFIAGAFTAAIVGIHLDAPGPILIVAVLVAASLAGGAVAIGPGYLRARHGVDEVVVTLMGNFVVVGVVAWLLQDFFLAQGTGNASTELIDERARLPVLIDGSQLTLALPIAIAAMAALAWWQVRHVRGYELRMTGTNPRFARAQGIDVTRVLIIAMVVSGLVGGLGGGAFTTSVLERYVDGGGANLGFTGIAVALLGRGNPWGMGLAALLLGALSAAGPTVQLFSDIPLDIVRVIQGTIIVVAVLDLARAKAAAR